MKAIDKEYKFRTIKPEEVYAEDTLFEDLAAKISKVMEDEATKILNKVLRSLYVYQGRNISIRMDDIDDSVLEIEIEDVMQAYVDYMEESLKERGVVDLSEAYLEELELEAEIWQLKLDALNRMLKANGRNVTKPKQ